jgi:DNA-binding MarR family transcriptional regulator
MILSDLLRAMAHRGACNATTLANFLAMDGETAGELVHWLEVHGYLEKKAAPAAGPCSRCSICPHPWARETTYTLTPMGRRQLAEGTSRRDGN